MQSSTRKLARIRSVHFLASPEMNLKSSISRDSHTNKGRYYIYGRHARWEGRDIKDRGFMHKAAFWLWLLRIRTLVFIGKGNIG